MYFLLCYQDLDLFVTAASTLLREIYQYSNGRSCKPSRGTRQMSILLSEGNTGLNEALVQLQRSLTIRLAGFLFFPLTKMKQQLKMVA